MKENLTRTTIRNVFYNSSATFIAKFGGFILTILLARMLLPEAFGIYALVLSIVIIIFSFTDLGVGETAVKYIAEYLGKNNKKKAYSYFWYLFKIRTFLIFAGALGLLIFSKLFAVQIFDKPAIFLPLVFAIFYVMINSFRSFFGIIFYAIKDLSDVPLVYLILHGSKIIFAIIALLLFSGVQAVSAVFIAFAASSLVSLISIFIILRRKKVNFYFKKRTTVDKNVVLRYLGFMSIANISLVIFGSVDTLMLGKFVETAYIGYYQAAFSLIASLTAIFSISGIFLPVFTQVYGKRLERALLKSLRYTLIVAIPSVIGLMFVANYIILIFYGKEYLPATSIVYVLAFLLIITPTVSLYSNLFKAKDKMKLLAGTVVLSLIMNIVLNYLLITRLLQYGQEFAILGAAIATVISRLFYLFVIVISTKSQFKINLPTSIFGKALISTLVMGVVLSVYAYYVDINLITGIIEILLGIIVYGVTMFYIKGLDKTDLDVVKTFLLRN